MNRFVSILIICFASYANAQVVEPEQKQPPKKVPTKFKASAPATVKANEHVLIDASSAVGEIWFFYNEAEFPKGRATTVGKVLILSTNVNGKYTVDVASLGDGAKEKITFVVTGGVDPVTPIPKPPDPKPVDPIEQINASLAKIEARLLALEQAKPNPPDPKPKPEPEPVRIDKLDIVVVWESDDKNAETAKVMKDLAFWKGLEPLGVRWFQYDKDQKIGGQLVIEKFGYKSFIGITPLPVILYLDKSGNVLSCVSLPTNTNSIREAVRGYLGK